MRLPTLMISSIDYNELIFALGFLRDQEDATFLAGELQSSVVCRPDDLPDSVVALNARVTCRLSGVRDLQTRLLVHPCNLLCPQTEVSAVSGNSAAGTTRGRCYAVSRLREAAQSRR